MGRLIVEVVSEEPEWGWVSPKLPKELSVALLASVSRAVDGAPMPGLTKANFAVKQTQISKGMKVWAVWPDGKSGFYRIQVKWEVETLDDYKGGMPLTFGLRVVSADKPANVEWLGQTVVRVHMRALKFGPPPKDA